MSIEQIVKAESTSAASERAMDAIVAELRELRNASLAARQRSGNPLKLPSRRALTAIVEGFSTVLFPNRLGSRQLAHESVDYYVGHTLDETCRDLVEQVVMELQFIGGQIDHREEGRQAQELVREFARGLPNIRRLLETDILAAFEGDPAARSIDEVLACYPGITAILHYRLAHSLHRLGLPLIARMIAEIAHSTTGIDIHPGAQIGSSFFIDHGTGVVIGETAVLGERVRLYHGVTLGAKRFSVDEEGALVKGNARHPIVEDEVVIYAGATILGRVTIGRGSVIGGNVWLTHSIAPGSQISQAKLRSEAFDDGSGI
ncbi:MAG TPA: serine O-acetyltransferase EpsC [Planctomycetaceae bacterium]|jgi:serine O-acetyltransferase|nr:serine O-acetyltransferase EpsC [Planctomycetaceae bacterium]